MIKFLHLLESVIKEQIAFLLAEHQKKKPKNKTKKKLKKEEEVEKGRRKRRRKEHTAGEKLHYSKLSGYIPWSH